MASTNQARKQDANFCVDKFAYALYGSRMPDLGHVIELIRKRHEYELMAFDKAQEERAKVAEAYNRYLDLTAEINRRQAMLERLVGAIERKGDLKLVEAIALYLEFDAPVKVADILKFLEWIAVHTSRQAAEAAINRYPKLFRVTKRGREKFVSLK